MLIPHVQTETRILALNCLGQVVTQQYFSFKTPFYLLTHWFYFIRKVALWDIYHRIRKTAALSTELQGLTIITAEDA